MSLLSIFAILLSSQSLQPPAATTEGEDAYGVYASGRYPFFEVYLEADGDARIEPALSDTVVLMRGGKVYLIVEAEDAQTVLDYALVVDILTARYANEFAEARTALETRPVDVSLEEIGAVEIGRWSGVGYRFSFQSANERPFAVVSDDPELTLLRDAILRGLSVSRPGGPSAQFLATFPLETSLLEMYERGAVVSYGGFDLSAYLKTDLDDRLFELPTKPLDEKATRAFMARTTMFDALKPPPRPPAPPKPASDGD